MIEYIYIHIHIESRREGIIHRRYNLIDSNESEIVTIVETAFRFEAGFENSRLESAVTFD